MLYVQPEFYRSTMRTVARHAVVAFERTYGRGFYLAVGMKRDAPDFYGDRLAPPPAFDWPPPRVP